MHLDHGELPSLDEPAFAVRHGGDLLGAITVVMPPQEPMTPTTERLLVDLSAQAGLVLRNVALVDELQRSRQRLVTSQDEARRRLERDLHDGAQQRLVTLSMDLRMARARADASGDVELSARLDGAEQELAQSLAELRELARGIHPAILTQNGVGAALRSLAERSPVLVELRSVPDGRYTTEVEATAYFIVSEASGERREACPGLVCVGLRGGGRRPSHDRGARRWCRRRGDERRFRTPRARGSGRGRRRPDRRSEPARRGLDRARRDPMRVAVADDAVLFREGLTRLLVDVGFDVVGQAADAQELLTIIREAPTNRLPDVTIVDIRMPPTHTTEGLVAAKTIRAEHPEIGVLVLSQYIETEHAMDLLGDGTGGTGYLLKDRVSDLDGFRDAVRRVAEGGSAVDPEVIAQLVGRRRATDPLANLTTREREVLSLMAEGCSNRAIGAILSLSEKTVEAHVRGIFTKLDLLAGSRRQPSRARGPCVPALRLTRQV